MPVLSDLDGFGSDRHQYVAVRSVGGIHFEGAKFGFDDAAALDAGQEVDAAEEAGHFTVDRAFEEAAGCAGLAHGALHQQADAVGHGDCIGLIVGDKDHGDAGLLLEGTDNPAQILAQARFQAAERFIQQEHARLNDEGSGQSDALALAAGQLIGSAGLVAGQLDGRQGLGHFGADGGWIDPPHFETKGDIGADVHEREESMFLKDHDRAPFLRGHIQHRPLVEKDISL